MKSTANIGVIFDMDGVLIDSPTHINTAFEYVFEHYGSSLSEFEKVFPGGVQGTSLHNIITAAKERLNIPIEKEYVHEHANRIFFESLNAHGVVAEKNLLNFLEELRSNNVEKIVGSASEKWRIDKILTILKIQDHFPLIVGADDVTKHKPDPEVFLIAAERIGKRPDQCVVIEDSSFGVEAAKKAGMKAIGYTKFSKHADKLTEADKIISCFSEISLPFLLELVEKRR